MKPKQGTCRFCRTRLERRGWALMCPACDARPAGFADKTQMQRLRPFEAPESKCHRKGCGTCYPNNVA